MLAYLGYLARDLAYLKERLILIYTLIELLKKILMVTMLSAGYYYKRILKS